MPSDPNQPQNPISEETTPKDGQDSIPASSQEPTELTPLNTTKK